MSRSLVITDAYDDSSGRYVTVEVRESTTPGIVIARVPFQFEAGTALNECRTQIRATMAGYFLTRTGKQTLSAIIGEVLQ